MKLIKVMNGLYRNEDGSVRVAMQLPWRGKPKHWTVRYTNFFSVEKTLEFKTLADARAFLKDSFAFN